MSSKRKKLSSDEVLDRILADSDSESELESDGSDDVFQPDENQSSDSEDEHVHAVTQLRQPDTGGAGGDCTTTTRGRGRGVNARRPAQRAVQQPNEWETLDKGDVFSLDWCPDFDNTKQYPCLKKDMTGKKPVDFFYEFFQKSLFTTFADQTNNYAMQFLDSTDDFPPKSRYHQWYDTNEAEMRAYVAIEIAMGLVQKPVLRQYWDSWWLGNTPFITEVMRQDRFILLRNFFHMNDNNDRVEDRNDPSYDKMFKIRPLMDAVRPTYMKLYDCSRNLSIDESMLRFKGRLSFRQYMPAKPTKWGIKLWALADSRTGFLLRWIPYTGKDPNADDTGLTSRVVLNLLSNDFDNKGFHLFTDNFYTSPELCGSLKDKGIGTCGTVRVNRRGLPPEIKATMTRLKKGDPPKFWKNENRSLLACAWQDTGRVSMVSTIHDSSVQAVQVRSKDTETGFRQQLKPNLAVLYNQNMGGVDSFDQQSGYYKFHHKCMKWYHVVYHFCKEAALVNGYIAYRLQNPEDKRITSVLFRREVIEGLLEGYDMPGPIKRGRRASNPKDLSRLTERHFVAEHGDKCTCQICSDTRAQNLPKYSFKPDCVVCSIRPRGCNSISKRTMKCKRKQTTYFCPDCPDKPALCATECFRVYHTKEKYKVKCSCD